MVLKSIRNKAYKVFIAGKSGYKGKLQKQNYPEQKLKESGEKSIHPCSELINPIENNETHTEKQVVDEVDEKDIHTNVYKKSFPNNNGGQVVQQNEHSGVTVLVERVNLSVVDVKEDVHKVKDDFQAKITFFNNLSFQHEEPSPLPKLSPPRLKFNTFGASDNFINIHRKSPSHNNGGQIVQQNKHSNVIVLVERANLSAADLKEDAHKAKDNFQAKITFFNNLSVQREESLHSPKLKFDRLTLSADFNVSTKLNETNLSTSRTQSLV